MTSLNKTIRVFVLGVFVLGTHYTGVHRLQRYAVVDVGALVLLIKLWFFPPLDHLGLGG